MTVAAWDARTLRSSLFNDGHVVIPQVVPARMCESVLEAIGTELNIWIDEEASWDKVSALVDQVPLWGHQSQWDIRQLPAIHDIYGAVWGTEKLWADRNSCRFTPPWREGKAGPLRLHWDADPRDRGIQWYPAVLALTDADEGEGGFCCSPNLMVNRDRWPISWPRQPWGVEYRPDQVPDEDIIEVPLKTGDLLIMDSHLPHGTVKNNSLRPRVVFYLQLSPVGSPEEAASNIADHQAGLAPSWWRWKPGHDRAESGPPAKLTPLGRRLLGIDPW
jgi:Phytanoyl-CoA dioxygenase (PhyH)